MARRFCNTQHADIYPEENDIFNGSLNELFDILSECWCAETCANRMRDEWTKGNMTLGQCSITAFLIQDIFKGEVYGYPVR